MNKDTIVKLTNRSNSKVVYVVPELGNLRRAFAPGETKEVRTEEVIKLSYTDGGQELLANNLVINNPDLIKEILNDVEPEYFYDKEAVLTLLTSGSNDQLLDALDFGGDGVIDLIKDLAVETKLNDVSKRNIILEKTGFDITKAIEINALSDAGVENAPKTRRAEPIAKTETPARRTTPPTYNVIKK